MKLIKKIAAIMFAFMMVFSLSTNVKAESGTSTNTTGSITITNAIKGQDYTIYKILNLESFNSEKGKEAYSYTIANGWENFFSADGKGSNYVDVKNGYVTWKDGADAANLAKEAIAYAKDDKNRVTAVDVKPTKVNIDDITEKLTYSNLELGYYLVDSSVGALCGLNTTNSTAKIEEKNSQPTLEKNIVKGDEENAKYLKSTTANIGDSIHYHVQITVGKGANNYVFHDEIVSGLKYHENDIVPFSVQITTSKAGTVQLESNDYSLQLDENKTSFTLKFEDSFIQKKLSAGDKIYLDYFATVTAGAQTDVALTNTAYLNYGNNQKTTEDYAKVYTYQIPVFKYTIKDGEKALSGAKFKLYRDSKDVNHIVKFNKNSNTYTHTYNSTGNVEELESGTDGYVYINGLSAGTYILEETKAPDGYNKLKDPITITVNQKSDGTKEIELTHSNECGLFFNIA